MKKQAVNPILPLWEYVPDGEPYVYGGRVYLFGSHDKFNGKYFCEDDYVLWSAPVEDLSDWRCEGVIYRKEQDLSLNNENGYMFAPDVVQGKDGKWYLYYTLGMSGIMSVAVSDTISGEYQYIGKVKTKGGHVIGTEAGDVYMFDPAIFIDGEKIYLYSGFSPRADKKCAILFKGRLWEGAYCFELEDDMLTVKGEPKLIANGITTAEKTTFKDHPFFEASSIRKFDGKYYFIYSSVFGHELCYATSDTPDGGFIYGGVIISNGDVGYKGKTFDEASNFMGNNHGGLTEINGERYIFYHRHTNRHSYSRQVCAEKVEFLKDGSIPQVEITSCGLNGNVLLGKGYYSAALACNLTYRGKMCFADEADETAPYITQQDDEHYLTNMQNGSVATFKYLDLSATNSITVFTRGDGKMIINDGEKELACFYLANGSVTVYVHSENKKSALSFKYEGGGAIDFIGFELN